MKELLQFRIESSSHRIIQMTILHSILSASDVNYATSRRWKRLSWCAQKCFKPLARRRVLPTIFSATVLLKIKIIIPSAKIQQNIKQNQYSFGKAPCKSVPLLDKTRNRASLIPPRLIIVIIIWRNITVYHVMLVPPFHRTGIRIQDIRKRHITFSCEFYIPKTKEKKRKEN